MQMNYFIFSVCVSFLCSFSLQGGFHSYCINYLSIKSRYQAFNSSQSCQCGWSIRHGSTMDTRKNRISTWREGFYVVYMAICVFCFVYFILRLWFIFGCFFLLFQFLWSSSLSEFDSYPGCILMSYWIFVVFHCFFFLFYSILVSFQCLYSFLHSGHFNVKRVIFNTIFTHRIDYDR